MSDEDWDYPWPPDYAAKTSERGEALAQHLRAIDKWLERSEPCQALSFEQRFVLRSAIWFFDTTAARAAQELRQVGVPEHAIGVATSWDVNDPKLSERAQNWLQAASICRRAREAVFAGRWGDAISLTAHAGMLSQTELAVAARGSKRGRMESRRSPNQIGTRNRHRRIAAEGNRMRQERGISENQAAEELAKRPGYPSKETIRKILRDYRRNLGILGQNSQD